MSEWSLRDTLSVLIVLAVTLSAAQTVNRLGVKPRGTRPVPPVDGIAQALIVLVGVVVALLWIGNFVLRGYLDAQGTPEIDS